MNPKVGVITVVRNGEKTIERCIKSVIEQTYKNIEYIIIDGSSSDRTVEIIKKYEKNISYWHTKKDNGIYDALNIGIGIMKSDFYVPLAADDIIFPQAIENLIKNHDEEYILMSRVKFNINGKISTIRNHSAGCLIGKSAHKIFGYYDKSYKIAADTKLINQVKSINKIKYIDNITGEFAYGGASSNYKKTILEHSRAMYESGQWNTFQKIIWLFPRLIFQLFKNSK